jgi:glucan phosphorylase
LPPLPRSRVVSIACTSCPSTSGGVGTIAYFSAEFALHQSLPIYAGGLGVLAGDHCKEASDLGVPLVGVGFMYPQGYFHQRISNDGWQEEHYERLNWADGAHRGGDHARGQAVHHGGAPRRPHRAGGGVARQRSGA